MRKLILLFLLMPVAALAQAANPPPKPELTEIWSPVPPKVEPGQRLGDAPSDAIILFNGTDLAGWESVKGGPAGWAGCSWRTPCISSALPAIIRFAEAICHSPHQRNPSLAGR